MEIIIQTEHKFIPDRKLEENVFSEDSENKRFLKYVLVIPPYSVGKCVQSPILKNRKQMLSRGFHHLLCSFMTYQ